MQILLKVLVLICCLDGEPRPRHSTDSLGVKDLDVLVLLKKFEVEELDIHKSSKLTSASHITPKELSNFGEDSQISGSSSSIVLVSASKPSSSPLQANFSVSSTFISILSQVSPTVTH